MLNIHPTLPESNGPAQFVADLADAEGRCYWDIEEWGPWLSQVLNPRSPLADMERVLLMAYDHQTISRRSKESKIEVNNPAIVITGSTPLRTLGDALPLSALLSGLAQRFCYAVAHPDKCRPLSSVPWFHEDRVQAACAEAADQIAATPILPEYYVTDEAAETYDKEFSELVGVSGELDESFVRRISYRSLTYCVLPRVEN